MMTDRKREDGKMNATKGVVQLVGSVVHCWVLGVGRLAAMCDARSAAAAEELPELRWVYLQQNLQVKENLPKIEAILRRAKAAGYNGVVLADYKLNILGRVPEHYFANAKQFKALCDELDL